MNFLTPHNDAICIYLAAQMALLARLFPFMVAHNIPEDDRFWMNFLVLLSIVDLLMAPQITHDKVAYLQLLVQQHHEEFVALYPEEVVTPKMHYMVHMPGLILKLVFSNIHCICSTCILSVDLVHWCIIGLCVMRASIAISRNWHKMWGTTSIYLGPWFSKINNGTATSG